MKLLTVLIPLLTAVVLVPTAVSRPLITDPTSSPALLGEPRSIGQASPSSPQPVQLDTNAKRFAKGLPPLSPSKSRHYKASPVRRTGASPLPPITYSGVIKVYNSDNGNPIGYISSAAPGYDYSALYQVQTYLDSTALRVHFTVPGGTTGTVTDLNMVTENSKVHNADIANYLGLTAPYDGTIVSGGSVPARMAGTLQTSVGSPPVSGANTWSSDSKVESAVWTVDVSTWSLTLKWINPDGSECFHSSPRLRQLAEREYTGLAPGVPFLSSGQMLFGDRGWWASHTIGGPVVGLSFQFVPAEDLPQ
ncbi:hypothetical protein FS837_002495 [Tulasnella sp. UAMH 9824]|nr:hypothetical protein FS837_002495 [Tulasnella sp. UAMH 9824]